MHTIGEWKITFGPQCKSGEEFYLQLLYTATGATDPTPFTHALGANIEAVTTHVNHGTHALSSYYSDGATARTIWCLHFRILRNDLAGPDGESYISFTNGGPVPAVGNTVQSSDLYIVKRNMHLDD